MAAVITPHFSDNVRAVLVDFTCDAAYPTGGYPMAPSTCGFLEIFGVDLLGNHPGVDTNYDSVNKKLRLFGTGSGNQAAHAELAANSTVVSAATILRLMVWGK